MSQKSISLDYYWLICEETRNEVEVNAPRLSIVGLFGFRKMTCIWLQGWS